MSKSDTIRIRAPKKIMSELRVKFPDMTDQNLIKVMYNTSLVRLENGLRGDYVPKKKRKTKQKR